MRLIEVTAVSAAALPIAALKEHLRLSSGFAMAPDQDGLLESYLRAAIAAIEGRVAKALIARRFRWELQDWRDPVEQALPVAPVAALVSLVLVNATGGTSVVPGASYRLIADTHRPRIAGVSGTVLPSVPTGARIEIEFDAGFGAAWTNVPPDLRQAVLLLAAEYYEHRHNDGNASAGLPHAVVTLIEPWRQVRVLGGRGRR